MQYNIQHHTRLSYLVFISGCHAHVYLPILLPAQCLVTCIGPWPDYWYIEFRFRRFAVQPVRGSAGSIHFGFDPVRLSRFRFHSRASCRRLFCISQTGMLHRCEPEQQEMRKSDILCHWQNSTGMWFTLPTHERVQLLLSFGGR